MGESDNNSQPSKKRAAGVQLTRDDPDLDDNEDSSEMEAGTFKKASDEVLATRRIVKVRRPQASTPAAATPSPAASNPFSAIRLVPSVSSTPVQENANSDKRNDAEADASKPDSMVDEMKGELTSERKKTDGKQNSEEQSEIRIDESKPGSDLVESSNNDVTKLDDGDKKSAANSETESKKHTEHEGNDEKENVEPVTGLNADDEVKNTKAADDCEIELKKDIEGEGDDKGKENVEGLTEGGDPNEGIKEIAVAHNTESEKDVQDEGNKEKKDSGETTGEKNAGTVSFGLFQQLSNSQNAFSGFAGTGFSSTSFSFGSVNKDVSSLGSGTGSLFGLNSDRPAFGFGPSNNGGSSIFGGAGLDASKNEGSKFPPMQEVPVETGEENEKSVFCAESIIFEFIDGAWKERGKGEIKVNAPTTGMGKARLVMRARGNYRLILNASLFPDMKLTNMEKKGITFACLNSAAEGKEGLSTVALRFKEASTVEEFRAVVTEHKSMTPAALKTPENSPKTDEAS